MDGGRLREAEKGQPRPLPLLRALKPRAERGPGLEEHQVQHRASWSLEPHARS